MKETIKEILVVLSFIVACLLAICLLGFAIKALMNISGCESSARKILTKDDCDVYYVSMCVGRDFKYVVCKDGNTKTIQEYSTQSGKTRQTHTDEVETIKK